MTKEATYSFWEPQYPTNFDFNLCSELSGGKVKKKRKTKKANKK